MRSAISPKFASPRWGLGLALAGAVLVAGPVEATDPEPTFARDVAPIIQQNCQACHQPGSIGPMSLTTYEEVRPWARAIRVQVASREMPPYHYDTDVGVQDLKHDRRLTKEEIETIVAWVDAGAPLGDPAEMPPPAQFPSAHEWSLAGEMGRAPDVVIKTDPYDLEAGGQDTWWRPVTPVGITEDRCIAAIAVRPSPGGRQVVHHANSDIWLQNDEGEYELFERVSEYALGKVGEIVPPGACRRLPANAQIRWDVHYFPGWLEEDLPSDEVELGLWLHPEDYEGKFHQDLRAYSLPSDLDIPPNSIIMSQGFHSFDHPVRIDSWQPHGHLRLRGASLEIYYPAEGSTGGVGADGGRRELISMVSNWNAGWHTSHMYEEHVAPLLPPGAVMIITHWYDNTAENPMNPDPTQFVGWGSRTTDEMSHDWIAITHLDEAEYERLLAERASDEAQ